MKIIYRYLFKKFLGPFVLTFFFALFILIMQFLWKYVDDLVGKGLEISIVLELLFYASATCVIFATPLAVLLSSLMTFGSLGEQYEIIAMKSAGISIRKLISSLSIFIILIAIWSFWFSDKVAPKAYFQTRTLLKNIVNQKPTLNIIEGVFYDGFDNYIIRVGEKKGSNIYDILIIDHTRYQGNSTFTYAKSGKMETTDDETFMLFYLYDGFYWNDGSYSSENNPLSRSTFSEQYKRFDISSFKFERSDNDLYSKAIQALSNAELVKMIDTVMISVEQNNDNMVDAFTSSCYNLRNFISDSVSQNNSNLPAIQYDELSEKEKGDALNRFINLKNDFKNGVNNNRENNKYLYKNIAASLAEWYKKYVFAVACILFFFIGAPLGTIIRKGGIGIPLVITVVFFILYFMLSIFGEKIAKGGAVPVWQGMWLSTFILIPICTFLTYQATVDSALLSSEELLKKVQQIKLKPLFAKKKNESTATHA
jgi:lipopolysaccharide export system permease protein